MGGATGSIGGLVTRLARRHEQRLRASLAASLERAVAEIDEPLRRGGAAIAIDRRAVAEAAPPLLEIAARLRAAAPLAPAALRLVHALLGDGAGPLYSSSPHRTEYPPGTLSRFARAILLACDDRLPRREPSELVRG